MSRRGTLIFYASAYVSVRLRLRPPVPLPVCVPTSLYPGQPAPSARSPPSLISPIFIPLIRFCLFFSLVLFFPFFPYLFIPLFLFLFFFHFLFTFSSSLIFPLPILLTLLALPATHPFELKTLYRERERERGGGVREMSPYADEDHHLMAFVRKMKLFTDVACSAQLDRTHARNAKKR